MKKNEPLSGEESSSEWQKLICKETKDTDPLTHHSHACSKPFPKNAAPLCAGSGEQEAASCSRVRDESSISSPGTMMGFYLAVQRHESQES